MRKYEVLTEHGIQIISARHFEIDTYGTLVLLGEDGACCAFARDEWQQVHQADQERFKDSLDELERIAELRRVIDQLRGPLSEYVSYSVTGLESLDADARNAISAAEDLLK